MSQNKTNIRFTIVETKRDAVLIHIYYKSQQLSVNLFRVALK